MHGVINILKPPGMTSHDVVSYLRRVCQTKRVGHTGTLDPAAAGVLPVCIGHATRLVEDLQAGIKTYRAELTFGYETDSCDATGTTVAHGDASKLSAEQIETALPTFRGEISQIPPLHSAVKVEGKRLYDMAHAGITEAEIPTRQVTIFGLQLVQFLTGNVATPPRALLDIECSGGTYIRSLVRDIGRLLGCRATMTFLVRTCSGPFEATGAATLEEVASDPTAHLWPLADLLRHCSQQEIFDDFAAMKLAQGQKFRATSVSGETSAISVDDRTLFWNSQRTIAVLATGTKIEEDEQREYRPEKVFFLDRMDD